MTPERIKEIQEETAYPNSVSVQQALLKVWNECEQGIVKNFSTPDEIIPKPPEPPKNRILREDGEGLVPPNN